ncbi:DNA polymerase III subunit gamma/tau [Aestuariivirga sp.]|uniref:DNA polymerase III subunit gamma/tau n=1 Tax=Aestuariivirga sp. TaxID=2650926 RepID=UPI0039E5B040
MASPEPATPAYRVLARKYRPTDFSALIGQEALVRTLTNAFATGRVAQAYMLTGVRGVGKTTTARLIARALNYPSGPTIDMPEMTAQCEAILESRHIDVIEMDAASNTGVDNMREIIDSVRYAPVQVRTKVYIIDEVHMLSKSAFNALLKTLEEPPPHVKFIFATTEIRKVPVTILSRCQRFDLKRLDAALLMQHYGRIAKLENADIEEEALRMIARAAEGSVRDGLSLLDQAIAYGDGKVKADDVANMLGLIDRSRVIELFDAVMAGDPPRALKELALQFDGGGDPETILTDMADFVHWVTRLRLVKDSAMMDGSRTEAEKSRGADFAAKLTVPVLSRAWQMLLKGIQETASASNPMQAAEMVLIRLAHAVDMPPADELARIAKSGAAPASNVKPMPLRSESTSPQAMGGGAAVAAALAPQSSQQAPSAPVREPVAFSDFAGLVAFVGERRDIKLKGELERFVRPITVSETRIEIALEKEAPAGLTNELMRKLEAWTGRRVLVTVAREGGAEPLLKQRRSAEAVALQEARSNPTVQAVLKSFPGAEIIGVREPQLLPTPTPEDADEESR